MSAPLSLRRSPRLAAKAARAHLDLQRATYKSAYTHYKLSRQEFLASLTCTWSSPQYARALIMCAQAFDSASVAYDSARSAYMAIVGADAKSYPPSAEIVYIDGHYVFMDAALDREMSA